MEFSVNSVDKRVVYQSLYHYTSAENAKKIIQNLMLKLSFSPKVNDPFDLGKDIIYDPDDIDGSKLFEAVCSDKELHAIRPIFSQIHATSNKQHLLSIVKRHIEEWDFKKIILSTPFICFSERNDIQLMWGHYGDGSRGVALEFSGSLISKAEKVIYEPFEKLPSVITKERLVGFLKNNNKELMNFGRDLLIKKHTDWGYEQEARLICDPRPDANHIEQGGYKFYKFKQNDLSAVYFGINCSHDDMSSIVEQLRMQGMNHVRIYQMKRLPGYISMYAEEVMNEDFCQALAQ